MTITAEQLHEMELTVPTYKFIEPEDDAQPVSPIKQQIAKIQKTATTFTVYDVYRAIGTIEKQIEDKTAEIKSLEDTKELFKAELALIEKALGVDDLERQFQVEVATEAAVTDALAPKTVTNEHSEGN